MRESFKEGKPIIDNLSDLAKNQDNETFIKTNISHVTSTPFSHFESKNIGYFMIEGIYEALGINEVIHEYKSKNKVKLELVGILKKLVIDRILRPGTIGESFLNQEQEIFSTIDIESVNSLYNALDHIGNMSEAIVLCANTKISKYFDRKMSKFSYDVTNEYFETHENDKDKVDKDGNVIEEGLRKIGHAKALVKQPIVQLALLVDEMGIPIDFEMFPGNHKTLAPFVAGEFSKMKYKRSIIIADGGLNCIPNRISLHNAGYGYIVAKSAKSSSNEIKEWLADEKGYTYNESKDFRYKSMVRRSTHIDKNVSAEDIKAGKSNKVVLLEITVGYWHKSYESKQLHECGPLTELIDEIERNKDNPDAKFKVPAKYIIKKNKDNSKDDDGQTESEKDIAKTKKENKRLTNIKDIDIHKVELDRKTLGHHTLISSEVEMDPTEIIDRYANHAIIEQNFRVAKRDLKMHPIYLSIPVRIKAFFLIIFISLIIIRVFQLRVMKYKDISPTKKHGWNNGISAESIISALNSMKSELFIYDLYRINNVSDDVILLANSIGIDIEMLFPKKAALKKLRSKIKEIGLFLK